MCITDCSIKSKPMDAKVVEKEVKEANEEKQCDVVKKIMRVWKEVVESLTEDSCASVLLKFKDCMRTISKVPCIC